MSGTAWWAREALAAATAEAERTYPNETGGVLLGWRSSVHHVVIAELIGPGPAAEHDRRSFRPDADWQQQRITEAYERSGRTFAYLGDWHTHPRGAAALSRRDVLTLRRIARHAPARARTPVMAVLAGGPEWNAGIWQIAGPYAWRAQPLHLLPYDG